jgi:hypothetical protein
MRRRRYRPRVACRIIGAWKPGVWQAGMRRRIGLGLVFESRLPTGETSLG